MFVFHGCRWCLFFIKQNNFSNNIETEDLTALEEKKKRHKCREKEGPFVFFKMLDIAITIFLSS